MTFGLSIPIAMMLSVIGGAIASFLPNRIACFSVLLVTAIAAISVAIWWPDT